MRAARHPLIHQFFFRSFHKAHFERNTVEICRGFLEIQTLVLTIPFEITRNWSPSNGLRHRMTKHVRTDACIGRTSFGRPNSDPRRLRWMRNYGIMIDIVESGFLPRRTERALGKNGRHAGANGSAMHIGRVVPVNRIFDHCCKPKSMLGNDGFAQWPLALMPCAIPAYFSPLVDP